MTSVKQSSMWAASCPKYSDHSGIEISRKKIPTPRVNEILIQVKATPLTAADCFMRSGTPWFGRLFLGFPRPKNPFLGTGFSGKVVKIGNEVKDFIIGDEVFGQTGLSFGANAEFLIVESNGVVKNKPTDLSHEQAACYTDGLVTSLNFLTKIANIQNGMEVLINGGAGSLGSSAIKIAKIMGCKVTATCSPRNSNFLKELGADHVIDYKELSEQLEGQQYDVIYDTVGKLRFNDIKEILKPKGKLLSPVLDGNLIMNVVSSKLSAGSKKVIFAATGLQKPEAIRNDLDKLIKMQKTGNLDLHIDKKFTIQQIPKAHKLIDTGHKRGNYIVTFN